MRHARNCPAIIRWSDLISSYRLVVRSLSIGLVRSFTCQNLVPVTPLRSASAPFPAYQSHWCGISIYIVPFVRWTTVASYTLYLQVRYGCIHTRNRRDNGASFTVSGRTEYSPFAGQSITLRSALQRKPSDDITDEQRRLTQNRTPSTIFSPCSRRVSLRFKS